MSEGNGLAGRDFWSRPFERNYETVEFGGQRFRIQNITERERANKIEMPMRSKKSGETIPARLAEIKARLIIAHHVDDTGNEILGMSNEDIELVMGKGAGFVDKLCTACCEHSGIMEADLEDIAKNSPGTESDSSPSG